MRIFNRDKVCSRDNIDFASCSAVINKMNEWLRNLYDTRCWCNLKLTGNIIGWLGVIYRSVAIIALAIYIAELPKEAHVYTILFSLLLAYCFVSLIANFTLLVGINKQCHRYLVLYIGVLGAEVCIIVILLVAGIILFSKINTPNILAYFIPCGVVFLGVYFYLWLCLVQLFEQFKSAYEERTSFQSRENDLNRFCCSLSCFRSASLDIAK
ncbi:hypothetical protein TcasGA2_TC031706 [Tribolium castaneum]|uniref:Uncharacterized protein n=1 Tax=Tribolium castaneum TaxID=7070 RepID=A0A139WL02_TRICA|nr:PREDICTED: uncharacterized protein LOC103312863 [Tribolium castaneum]XP_015833824.1 PREDICTED: uncharacterized protein LOC103312863 [Tribolium castaneum]XP_015833825.1 PREDICTED: uncharacterized protein LOC103312863 [Tribolium castaneum]KYB28507.1 hypothetical protein TcasGA2_TC031706 [Tribolium castaneum]|eukprot:XP_015833823.1 PREDICTED: uncharacterized protein LOC103312863 [Tribolium castaneum]